MPSDRLRCALLCDLMFKRSVHHARGLAFSARSISCNVISVKEIQRSSPGCILAALGHWQCRDELLISKCAFVDFTVNVLQKHH